MIVGEDEFADAALTRFVMYEALCRGWRRLGLEGALPQSVLSVSGSEALCAVLGFSPAQVVAVAYPDDDLTSLSFDDGAFDAVVCDQVLEHVGSSPYAAVAEAARVLRPGGRAIFTTCLLNPVHPAPDDFWRFTPSGLRLLCESVPGVRVLEVRGWGNRLSVVALAAGFRRFRVARLPKRLRERALRDDWRWPIVTWTVFERARVAG